MRTVRVADPSEWVTRRPAPPPPHKRSVVDWLATAAMVLLPAVLLVVALPTSASGPLLAASPSSVAAGGSVNVSGTGFRPRDNGRLALDGSTAGMPKYRANASGSFSVRVSLPASEPAGHHRVSALAPPTGSPDIAFTTVDITAASTSPTPSPTSTPTPTLTPTAKPTSTPTPSATPASTPTATPTPTPAPAGSSGGILLSASEIRALPMSGAAWSALKSRADQTLGIPDVANQDDMTDVYVLAKAVAYIRTGISSYRQEVLATLKAAVGTEIGGTALAESRNMPGYVISADLIDLPSYDPTFDSGVFRPWLRVVLDETMSNGTTLTYTAEHRPNNWGTHAGAARTAIAAYLGDGGELARQAKVFRGWLGDRSAYAGFTYGDTSWQCDPTNPVGINPVGCSRDGHSLDGVLPDDLRRAGSYAWPPPQENYVWEALQGATLEAALLTRAGYPAWTWQDKALLRAVRWLYNVDAFPATGDDEWVPWLVDNAYATSYHGFPPAQVGKNFGWTDWLYGF